MTSGVEQDAYAVLGVGRDADDETIAIAHRALARRFHPDIAGDTATSQMSSINAAFDAICTADRRAEYLGTAAAPAAAERSSSEAPQPDILGRERLRWTPERDGTGGAGPPPGRPSGRVLDFGRHIGWSLGEIARVDPGYLAWLAEKREGQPYLEEIDATLRRIGYRPGAPVEQDRGPGLGVFRRR